MFVLRKDIRPLTCETVMKQQCQHCKVRSSHRKAGDDPHPESDEYWRKEGKMGPAAVAAGAVKNQVPNLEGKRE